MASSLGTPLSRKSVAWIWFAVAVGLTAYLAWNAAAKGSSWWGAAICAAVAGLIYLEPRLRRRDVETIQLDDSGILRVDRGIREEIGWNDVEEIRIITTTGGPLREDVFFAFFASGSSGCVVPHDAAVRIGLLEDLQARFPNLDNDKVIEAMGCTSNRTFIVWKKDAVQPSIRADSVAGLGEA
jgi:hypothetical protein